MFQCNQCDVHFEYLYQLIMHRNIHKTVPTVSTSYEKQNPGYVTEVKFFFFIFFKRNFVYISELNLFCDRCSTGFSSHNLYVQHIQKHAEIDTKCSLCPKVFSSTRNLELHVRLIHTRGEKQ